MNSERSSAMAEGGVFSVVVLIALTVSASGNFTVPEHSELIGAVSKHLHCGFVMMLTSASTIGKPRPTTNFPPGALNRYVRLGKHLSDLGVTSAIWDFKTFIRKLYSDDVIDPPKTLVVVEYTSRNLEELSVVSREVGLAGFVWLILTFSPGGVRQIRDVIVSINTQFLVSTSLENNSVALYEMYQISRHGELFVSRFGVWTPDGGLQKPSGDMFSRRMDLKGYEFKFAVHNLSSGFDPCEYIQVDNGKQMIQCAYFEVWKDLEHVLNYSTKYVVIEDCYQNGSQGISTPMLEMIRTGGADSGEDGYVWSSSRLVHNQFLWPLFHSKVILVTKIPSRKFSFSSYVRPFVKSMWMVLIGWLLLSGMVINAIKHIAARKGLLPRNEYLENFFIPLTAICYQSSTSIPKKAAVRLAYLMIYLIPVLFIPSYSGSIISSLSVPSHSIPFNDLEEFERDGTYKLAAINNTFFQFFLTTDDQFEIIRRKKLVSTSLTVTYEQSFEEICSKKMTFIFGWPLLSRYTINCDVFRFDLSLKKIFSSMAVRRNFPYLELFNRQMQKLISTGLNLKILEKNTLNLFKHEVNPFPQRFYQIKPFGFEDVLPLFAILLGGMCLSVLVMVFERHGKFWTSKPTQLNLAEDCYVTG